MYLIGISDTSPNTSNLQIKSWHLDYQFPDIYCTIDGQDFGGIDSGFCGYYYNPVLCV